MWRALGWERGGEPARAICQSVSQRHVPPSSAPSTLSASAGAEAEPQSLSCRRVGRSFEGRKDAVDQWRLSISECCPVETVPRDEEFTQRRRASRILALSFPPEGKRSSFTSFARLFSAKDGGLCVFFCLCFLQMFKGRNVAQELLLLCSTRPLFLSNLKKSPLLHVKRLQLKLKL